MRTSRLSQETVKLFGDAAAPSPGPRRSTRLSLSQFAFTTASKPVKTEDVPDIEDAITPRKRRKIEDRSKSPVAVPDAPATPESSSGKTPRRARKPARKIKDEETGESAVAPPSDWEEMYTTAMKMRRPGGAASNAAVDTMGCERLADREASAKDQRFHTLIALMMSSQTKDTTNAAAMLRLKTELPPHKPGAAPGLNLDNILAVDPKLLNELIWAVGFHNNKTKYIKQAAEILRDRFDGDIPSTIEGLTSLPGVGPKMAYLCLSSAWGRDEGIGVDVHVHRISNLWGWNRTKTPEETRLALQAWLPRDKWREINWLLVGLGQTVCLPVGKRCGDCELGLRGLCKAAERGKVIQGRKRLEEAGRENVKVEAEVGIRIDDVRHVPEETGR